MTTTVCARDSTAECMQRFFTERIRDHRQIWEPVMVKFIDCDPITFYRWFYRGGKPGGLLLLRLRIFLELVGYSPIEWRAVDPTLQKMAKLLVFGVINQDQAVAVSDSYAWPGLLKNFLGQKNSSRARLVKMLAFADSEENKRSLAESEKRWRGRLPGGLVAKTDLVTEVAVPLAPSLKSANRIVTPEAVQPKTDRLEILWKALGPLAEILAPQSVKIGEIYARYQRRLSEDGSELPELTPENFTKQELSPAELAKLVEHTKWALTQARGCLAVLAQVAKGDLRQESLQAIRLEATELWHTYQVAKALIPEEILTEIWMSSAFSARGSEPVKKGKTNDQDRK